MDSGPGPYSSQEALAVLWVTAASQRRIAPRLCTSWVVCLAEAQGARRPWPAAGQAAAELHAWSRRPDDPVVPSDALARLEAATSSVWHGLSRVAIEVAVDSCQIEAAVRLGRSPGSNYVESQLALRSYVAATECGALTPSAAMRHVVDAAFEGEDEMVLEVAASLIADWEGDLPQLLAASRRLARPLDPHRGGLAGGTP